MLDLPRGRNFGSQTLESRTPLLLESIVETDKKSLEVSCHDSDISQTIHAVSRRCDWHSYLRSLAPDARS
jgi:hypothetical protein